MLSATLTIYIYMEDIKILLSSNPLTGRKVEGYWWASPCFLLWSGAISNLFHYYHCYGPKCPWAGSGLKLDRAYLKQTYSISDLQFYSPFVPNWTSPTSSHNCFDFKFQLFFGFFPTKDGKIWSKWQPVINWVDDCIFVYQIWNIKNQ